MHIVTLHIVIMHIVTLHNVKVHIVTVNIVTVHIVTLHIVILRVVLFYSTLRHIVTTYLRLADIEKDVLFAFPVHIRAKLENFTDEITERDINKIKMFSMFGFPSFFENEALFTSLFEIKTEGEYGNEKTRTLLLVLYFLATSQLLLQFCIGT